MAKKLSLIVPVYNTEQYLDRCLKSCVSAYNKFDEYEVIIVNDGSTDSSLSIIKRYQQKYPQLVYYITKPNGGLSSARNLGIRKAKGEYIWFIDSDDSINTYAIDILLTKLSMSNIDAIQIGFDYIVTKENTRTYINIGLEKEVSSGLNIMNRGKFYYSACVTIYNREFLINNNLFFYEGIYHEDMEFTPRAYICARNMTFIKHSLYFYYKNENSIMTSVNPKKAYDNLLIADLLFRHSLDRTICEKKIIYRIIPLLVNNALSNTLHMSIDDKRSFIIKLKEYRHLYRKMLKNSSIKMKIEALLLLLSPSLSVQIYNFIKNK